jgi:uncharacterized membrane protein
VARVTALPAHPRFIGGLALVVAAWMTLNLLAAQFGYRALDPPPFPGWRARSRWVAFTLWC